MSEKKEMSSKTAAPMDTTNKAADAPHRGEFFSMFYLPSSSQSYDEDVHLATSTSYSAPFQGAATAVVGGILSVLDTALAALNEEFDNPSDSIISDSTRDESEDEYQGSGDTCMISKNNVLRCCKQNARSKLPTSVCKSTTSSTNEDNTSDRSKENSTHVSSIEQSSSLEKDYFTPQNSLIGSISTLQLFEESAGDFKKAIISNQHSKPINNTENERNTNALNESLFETNKKEDSEYCIIKHESETNDGWLVVSDD
eukprot:CAMPEP_0183779950 /NCGR_PEP_ID=MMETSP0739-20130205/55106_1 /TAXON_ID=385413 /ORGANISM="Thalassiosira miniscula, Strain CCMP1093" /LENGTH=255 /DNA_ID=CAMNT_0026022753 /DNA_START=105 /DNA_END=872 /DNA_ORIENTATION=+